MNHTSEGMQ